MITLPNDIGKRKILLIKGSLASDVGQRKIEGRILKTIPAILNKLTKEIAREISPQITTLNSNWIPGADAIAGHFFEGVVGRLGAPFDGQGAGASFPNDQRGIVPQGLGSVGSLFGDARFATIPTEAKRQVSSKIENIKKKIARDIAEKETLGMAKGGSVTDTVPALLTPGEFVVSKNAAQRFGYKNLRRINKMAKGREI